MEENSLLIGPLSVFWRWYIYALHGYATEIIFTAGWEFVFNLNWKLMGNTSIWIMPIYGISGLVCEQIYIACKSRGMPLILRGFVYLAWTYIWEFSSGFVLKQFDLCPWDYSHYEGDFMGLITLEYAPLWYLLGLMLDLIVLPLTRQLYWGPTHDDFNVLKKQD
ncbi:transmembrane protein 229B-like [Dreissena polymorpha]|uniref:Transmembrane protein 229B n=1 Tax=Dreissena polymorpha TaxID=45954 RepID=A0A9D4QXB7_DREPO|nr:transmembrane protein 229B-like [Dreissena polymorpha]KAH3846388.1 hypothetical protein DPMN_088689 [Dreissena polymorpha]